MNHGFSQMERMDTDHHFIKKASVLNPCESVVEIENADESRGNHGFSQMEQMDTENILLDEKSVLNPCESVVEIENADESRKTTNSARLCERSPRILRSSDKCLSKNREPQRL